MTVLRDRTRVKQSTVGSSGRYALGDRRQESMWVVVIWMMVTAARWRTVSSAMPTISVFYGIIVRMYWADHAPPHFHALYGEYEATIEIGAARVVAGWLPRRALALSFEWAAAHRDELMENWELCATKQPPKRIDPLP